MKAFLIGYECGVGTREYQVVVGKNKDDIEESLEDIAESHASSFGINLEEGGIYVDESDDEEVEVSSWIEYEITCESDLEDANGNIGGCNHESVSSLTKQGVVL